MMDDKRKGQVKLALEYGPLLAFFAGYILLKDHSFLVAGRAYSGFIAMTALFVPLLALATFATWRLTGEVNRMQLFTLALVVVFGAATVILNDERFFKMKVTIIYGLFAAGLGFGLVRGQSYLQALMGAALPLAPAGWMILTRRIAWFFAGLALANELIWRGFSTETWVTFKTFGLPLALFGFFMTQGALFKEHGTEEDEADGQS